MDTQPSVRLPLLPLLPLVNNAVDVSHTLEVILSGKVYPAKE